MVLVGSVSLLLCSEAENDVQRKIGIRLKKLGFGSSVVWQEMWNRGSLYGS